MKFTLSVMFAILGSFSFAWLLNLNKVPSTIHNNFLIAECIICLIVAGICVGSEKE